MSVRLPVTKPSGLKKSIRTVCVPAEVFPSTMSVDHAPPVTTCGNTSVAVPPIAVAEVTVGTGELLTVTGGVKNIARWRRRRQAQAKARLNSTWRCYSLHANYRTWG